MKSKLYIIGIVFLLFLNVANALNVTEIETLLDNQNDQERENISYSLFGFFLLIISGICFWLGIKKEEDPLVRTQVKKYAYLTLSFFHAFFFFSLLRGYVSEQSFWRITYVYGGFITSFIVLILAFIIWEVKEEIMDDPFFWWTNLIARLKKEKSRKRFNK